MKAGSIRPSSGTGHSTSPPTSLTRPGSSTMVSCRSAARWATPSAITRLRSSASTRTRRSRSVAAQSVQDRTATAPGAWKRCPSVRSDDCSPCPSSAPSRRSNGTTAPSSRQVMRRSGRTQVNALVPPQRIDFGQGKRRSSVGTAAAISAAVGTEGAALSSTQYSPSTRSCAASALCLRRKPVSACSGAVARGPRSTVRIAATSGARRAASAMRRGP